MNYISLKNSSSKDKIQSTCSKKDSFFDNLKQNKWLNTKEAASYLGLSPNALRIMVHRGMVKAYRLSNRLRFRIPDLNNAVSAKKGVRYEY